MKLLKIEAVPKTICFKSKLFLEQPLFKNFYSNFDTMLSLFIIDNFLLKVVFATYLGYDFNFSCVFMYESYQLLNKTLNDAAIGTDKSIPNKPPIFPPIRIAIIVKTG